MKYRITITQVEEITEEETAWVKLYDSEAFAQIMRAEPGQEQYGYKTKTITREQETEIYDQTLEGDINMMAVIKAFNGDKDES